MYFTLLGTAQNVALKVLSSLTFPFISSCLSDVVTRASQLLFCPRRVELCQRGVTRVVLLLCHVGSSGPR